MNLRILLLVTTVLAGCAAPNPSAPRGGSEETDSSASTGTVEVHHFSFSSLAGFSDANVPVDGSRFAFTALQNATGLMVELAWNSTVWDLDLFLQAEWWQCTEEGDGPLTDLGEQAFCATDDAIGYERTGEFVDDAGSLGSAVLMFQGEELQTMSGLCEAECDWLTWAEGNTPRASLEWHIFVSVFYDRDIPTGYSAVPR